MSADPASAGYHLAHQLQRALSTTVFDAAGNGSAKACWALMRRATADNFASATCGADARQD
jgi:hypothetical protein